MAQKSAPIELQPLSQPDDEPLISDKPITWSQSLSRLKFRLLRKKITSEDWKKTLYLGSASTVVVLVFNVGFVLWAVKHHGLQDDQAILFSRNCKESKKISTGFHLVINILGTILLGASNYGMREVAGYLMYNSTIFQTLSVYKYNVLVGNKPLSSFNVNNVKLPSQHSPDPTLTRLLEKDMNRELKRFNNRECISNYATGLQTNYASLLLVTDEFNSTTADFGNLKDNCAPETDPYRWICTGYNSTASDRSCTSLVPQMLADPDTGVVNNYSLHSTDLKVKYCLSESILERCTVEYSLPLILVVIIANIIKTVILWGITITMADTPILTTGDAISSFIKTPGDTTRGQCLLSRDVVIERSASVQG